VLRHSRNFLTFRAVSMDGRASVPTEGVSAPILLSPPQWWRYFGF
jgi:hypothetical protein